MLKKYAMKKIMLSSIALLILSILYFFPKDNKKATGFPCRFFLFHQFSVLGASAWT